MTSEGLMIRVIVEGKIGIFPIEPKNRKFLFWATSRCPLPLLGWGEPNGSHTLELKRFS